MTEYSLLTPSRDPVAHHTGFVAHTAPSVDAGFAAVAAAFLRSPPFERRRDAHGGSWLMRMLDEIDYGMLLISAEARVLYSNHAARQVLQSSPGHTHALLLQDGVLRPRRAQDVAPLAEALAASARGLRSLLVLGSEDTRSTVSVVPLAGPPGPDGGDNGASTLLVLGRREMCPQLSVRGYAREVALTPTETRVLEMLCDGFEPSEIAQQQTVALSTVRTQIGSIRAKTGAGSIRELVLQVARLPPLVGALRGAACKAN